MVRHSCWQGLPALAAGAVVVAAGCSGSTSLGHPNDAAAGGDFDVVDSGEACTDVLDVDAPGMDGASADTAVQDGSLDIDCPANEDLPPSPRLDAGPDLESKCPGYLLLPERPVVPDTSGYLPRLLADLDGDGRLDLLVDNVTNGTQVLLGREGGRFEYLVHYDSLGSEKTQDLNADGIPDIVGMSYGRAVFAPGRGDGRFATPVYRDLVGATTLARIVDLDGDGAMDVATCDRSESTAGVIMNHGDGTFAAPVTIPVPPADELSGAAALEVADVDGDGRTDIIVLKNLGLAVNNAPVTSGPDQIAWLRNLGGGKLGAPIDIDVPSTPAGIAVTDLDHDRVPDLVVYGTDSLMILRGLGEGRMAEAVVHQLGFAPTFLTTGDLDADGNIDLILSAKKDLIVLFGRGDGSFETAPVYSEPADRRTIAATMVADVTADGLPDLIVGGSRLLALVNQGSRQLVVREILPGDALGSIALDGGVGQLAVGIDPQSVHIADFNGDTISDLLVENAGNKTASVLFGLGGGKFSEQVVYPTGDTTTSLQVHDMNGDGAPDMLLGCSDGIRVSAGQRDGTFREAQVVSTTPSVDGMVAADLNGDALSDLAFLTSAQQTSDGRHPRTLHVLTNQGDGVFLPGATYGLTTDKFAVSPGGPTAVAGDFDGNGTTDLVVASGNPVLLLYLNDGSASFAEAIVIALQTSCSRLQAHDLDRDGRLDLVASSDSVEVLYNRGHGTFEADAAFFNHSAKITLGDLDGDGWCDIVTLSQYRNTSLSPLHLPNTANVLINQGRFFAPAASYDVGFDTSALTVGDLDGDGRVDLLVSHQSPVPKPLLSGGHPPQNDPGWLQLLPNRGWACRQTE